MNTFNIIRFKNKPNRQTYLKQKYDKFHFAKGSFLNTRKNEYTLLAIMYKDDEELDDIIKRLELFGFEYDGIFTPLQQTEIMCDHAQWWIKSQGLFMTKAEVNELKEFIDMQ